MHIVHGQKKILKKGEKFIFLELTYRKIKGGPLPADPPFTIPHGLGDTPRPRNGVMIKWDDSKNAPRGKCRLRTAVSAIIVGDGAHDVPSTKSNVRFRYTKNQPLLLPNIKNAASAASLRKVRSNTYPFN